MKKSQEEIEEEYIVKRREGMDISAIRKELKQKRFSEEEIKRMIRRIDDETLYKSANSPNNESINLVFIGGVVLLIAGSIITLGSLLGWFDFRGYQVIAHGPILGGLAIMAARGKKRSKFQRERRFRK